MVYGEQNSEGNQHLVCILCMKMRVNPEKNTIFGLNWAKNPEKIKKSKIRFLQLFCPIFAYLWPKNQVSGSKIEGEEVKSVFFRGPVRAHFTQF